jgi:hypothetical protein
MACSYGESADLCECASGSGPGALAVQAAIVGAFIVPKGYRMSNRGRYGDFAKQARSVQEYRVPERSAGRRDNV